MTSLNRLSTTLVTLLAAGSAACRPDGACTDLCGTAIIVTPGRTDAIVPAFTDFSNGFAIGDQLFLKLADIGPDLQTFGDDGFIPKLARHWAFEDSLTIVFDLAPDARWHDGAPVTARDVEFTFDVYRDTIVNAPQRVKLDRIASVRSLDADQVVFSFNKAYPEQFYDATHHMRILPAHLLDTVPRTDLRSHPFTRHPVGNGPYEFVSWIPGESVELAANRRFFLGTPGIARLIWQRVPELNTGLSQLIAGEADILEFLGPPTNVARVEKAANVDVYTFPAAFYYYIAFNFRARNDAARPHALFGDPDIRRAIVMSVNREEIAEAVFGAYGVVPPGPTSRLLWIFDPEVQQIPFDTVAARRLLTKKGWTDTDGDGVIDRRSQPLAFELILPSSSDARVTAGVILQEQLRRMGVRVTVHEMEGLAQWNQAASGDFDATFGSWVNDPSPNALQQTWGSGSANNQGRYTDPEFDAAVLEAIEARDIETARAAWRRAQDIINRDAPGIWVMTPLQAAGVSSRFDTVSFRADQWSANLWRWRVRPGQAIPRDRPPAR